MGIEAIIVLLLILANGVFAMAEMAVVAAKKARLKKLADDGNQRAQGVLELAESPNRFLSTVQFGITLIGILAGAFGGATIAESITEQIKQVAVLADYSEAIGIGAVVVAITFLSLVLGEIVPKRVALNSPESISMMIVGPMNKLSRLAAPFVNIVSWTTEAVLKIIGVRKSREQTITQDEIKIMVEQGTHAGVFHKAEIEMVEGVMRLDEEKVQELMTPRAKIVWININDSEEVSWRKIVSSEHSYFPVFEKNRDNVLGLVSVKSIWANAAIGVPTDLRNLLIPPLVVPHTMTAVRLLETFKQSGKHIALVSDEFGGMVGLVTLIDVMEAIVGEIPSEEDRQQVLYIKRTDGSFLVDAMLEIDQLKKLLEIDNLPNELVDEYQSVGGFLMSVFGRIPKEGDTFEHADYQFEIMDMDRHRIDKVLVTPMDDTETRNPKPENE